MDDEGDMAFVPPPTQDATQKGDSHVAGFATPEVYPPTSRQGSLKNTDTHAKGQKERKVAEASTADLPSLPEEVPIEDPCECQGRVDESRVLRNGKKRRNRASDDAVADANEMQSQADGGPASSSETQDEPDIFGDEPTFEVILGAVAVPGINSDNDDMNYEQPSHETPPGMASDIESTVAAPEETPQMPIEADVVEERGQGMPAIMHLMRG